MATTKKNEFVQVIDYDKSYAHSKNLLPGKNIEDLKKISTTHFFARDEQGINHLFTFSEGRIEAIPILPEIAKADLNNIIIGDGKIILLKAKKHDAYKIKDIIIEAERIALYPKSIRANDSMYNWGNSFSLSYNNRHNIRIEFVPLTKFEDALVYEYALITNSSDTTWSITKLPEVNLLNTNWGKYILLFRAYNSQFNYSNTISIKLNIAKPFYLRWWFLLPILLSIILGPYYYSLVKIRRANVLKLIKKENEKKFLQSEFKYLNALMNPHFIFNSLNSIQGIINAGDQEGANKYLETFSNMMRQNMKNIQAELISLEKEISLVENYLQLEKLRFREKISYSISIDPEVDLSEISVPPLSLQPIVENSVKHGIFPLVNRPGEIKISIFGNNGETIVQVIDNGIGYSNSKRKTGNNMALTNIATRFAQLSEIHNKKISFTVGDYIIEDRISGTIAKITLFD